MLEMVLGSVQFGFPYGVSNSSAAAVSRTEVTKILQTAHQVGIKTIDTAAAYGQSESTLGTVLASEPLRFNIITKALPNKSSRLDATELAAIQRAFDCSLSRLQQPSVYGLMIHHAEDLLKPGGKALWQWLEDLKKQGLVQKIGCSFYNREQVEQVLGLGLATPDLVQVPANIFDQRLFQQQFLSTLHNQGIEVYVRSVFLQGLIFLDQDRVPTNIKDNAWPYLKRFKEACKQYHLSSIELALMFFKDKDYVKLVVGVTSQRELTEIAVALAKVRNMPLAALDFSQFVSADISWLNPSLWSKA